PPIGPRRQRRQHRFPNPPPPPQPRYPPARRRRQLAPDQPVSRPRVPRHHCHLHSSDGHQRSQDSGCSGQALPTPEGLSPPACDPTGRRLTPALAGVRAEVWRAFVAFPSARRRRHCFLPHPRLGRPPLRVRLRPPTLCLSLLQPSGLSAVRLCRRHGLAGASAAPALAPALLSGHLHRPQTIARTHSLPPKAPLRPLATTQRRSLADVGRDHKNLGAEMGLLAVLQTWTRDLRFHPHVHCVVPAGGLSPDRLRRVRPQDPAYFLPQTALAMRL